MSLYAAILSVPRIAPVRPSIAPALIKTLFKEQGKNTKVFDLNIDFYNCFTSLSNETAFHELDTYFFVENSKLSDYTRLCYNKWLNEWAIKISQLNTPLIMISVFTWQAQQFTKDFLSVLRPLTHAKVIIGGQGMIRSENTSFNTKPVFAIELKELGLIDHWIQGEAETVIKEIVKENFCFKGIDTYEYAERKPLSETPICDFGDLDIYSYHSGYQDGSLPLESSRGCVRACTFCDWPVAMGGFRSKNGNQLANELITYYNNYKVTKFYFNDALINGSIKDFRLFNNSLVNFYQEQNLPSRYFTYSGMYIVRNAVSFKEQDFELMGKAGADTMLIGVETGSDRVRADMQKGFNSLDLKFTIEQFSKNKIKAYWLLIVGYPTETRDDFNATLQMLRDYQRYVADGTITGINFGTTLTIGEGVPLWHDYQDHGIVGIDGNRPHDIFWMHNDNPTLTYKERILRRIEAQELAIELGYTFWKGDDQLKFVMQKYQSLLDNANN